MADYGTIRRAGAGTATAAIDEGLRAHMNKVYGLMAVGMIITGLVAYVVGTDFARAIAGEPTRLLPVGLLQAMFTSPLKWVIMFAPLAVVFGFSAGMNRMSVATAQAVFWLFAALMGLSISWIFAVFTGVSIAQVFFVTAIAFASLSLWGYTTKKDISGWGSFLIMGVVGLIVASLINIWLASPAVTFAVSALGVLIFAGLTAYDTQNIKNTYLQLRAAEGQEFLGKAAIMGALQLYLDFLNMFMMLLQLFLSGLPCTVTSFDSPLPARACLVHAQRRFLRNHAGLAAARLCFRHLSDGGVGR
jgi:FtsH-binding integral membrane protein